MRQDFSKVEVEGGEVISLFKLVKAMKPEHMAELIDDFCNYGMKDFPTGKYVGQLCRSKHRTIQGSIIRFCLGVIIGLSQQEYTDPRNEVAIAMAKKISDMVDNGELSMGYII